MDLVRAGINSAIDKVQDIAYDYSQGSSLSTGAHGLNRSHAPPRSMESSHYSGRSMVGFGSDGVGFGSDGVGSGD